MKLKALECATLDVVMAPYPGREKEGRLAARQSAAEIHFRMAQRYLVGPNSLSLCHLPTRN